MQGGDILIFVYLKDPIKIQVNTRTVEPLEPE
jgi:hypothetical protein